MPERKVSFLSTLQQTFDKPKFSLITIMKLKKARTPFLKSLQRAMRIATSHRNNPYSVHELIDMEKSFRQERRRFIGQLGQASLSIGAGSLLAPTLFGCKEEDTGPTLDRSTKISIVGAGIAGLNTAFQLQKKGIGADIYEGSSSTGGRIRTVKNLINTGLYTDLGGEFINSDHEDMLNLIQELGLTLFDTFGDDLEKDIFFIDGEIYSMEEAVQDLQPIIGILEEGQLALEDYESPAFMQLDNMTLEEYIALLPTSDKMRKLLTGAYEAEFGASASDQSPIYTLYTIGTDTSEGVNLLAASDQRFRLRGGSQKLIDALTDRLKDQISYGYRLSEVRKTGNKVQLIFDNGKVVATDFAIITVPSSILKEIKFDLPEMPVEQEKIIQEMGMGTNSKLMMGFDTPVWRVDGKQGYLYGDIMHNGWDHTTGQDYQLGAGYTVFLGGKSGVRMSNHVQEVDKEQDIFLPLIEKAFSGNSFNGKAAIANWPGNPFAKGSYLCPKPGQMNQLELLGQPVGNVLFAGEHTSVDYQGYMNGGAETGRIAAEHVLEKIGKS